MSLALKNRTGQYFVILFESPVRRGCCGGGAVKVSTQSWKRAVARVAVDSSYVGMICCKPCSLRGDTLTMTSKKNTPR